MRGTLRARLRSYTRFSNIMLMRIDKGAFLSEERDPDDPHAARKENPRNGSET